MKHKAAAAVMQEKETGSGLRGRYLSVVSFVRTIHILTDAESGVVITCKAEIIAR